MATTNLTNLKANVLTDVVSTILSTTGVSSVPKITTITYPGDDTAADTGGGQTISISGSGFNIGASVIINGTVASVVTVVSATSLTFTAPAQSAGTYTFYVVNTDGGTAIVVPGISYSGTPSWSTSAGSLGTSYETNAVSNTVTATGDATISYSLFSGTLPTGSSLNTSTGAITGTSAALNSPTTYSFVIRATDGQNQDTDRSFSITINPDAVTWISPEDNSTTTAYEHTPVSNVTLSATSAAGKSITFTANTLPTGVTITGNTISGTPTVVANTNTRLTANTATTFKTATKDINFVVNPDVVSWSSPADGTSTALLAGEVMANVTLSATSAAGKSITYTANTLPTGVTITGAVVNGTPTVDGNTNSLITATATTTNRTATRNFTWVVSVANDTFFKNTTLLLNGETTVTPFISDASTNSFGLTINGDTEPTPFNPYQEGYYSNFFNDSDRLYTSASSANAMGTGDYTVEAWIYVTAAFGTSGSGRGAIISNRGQISAPNAFMLQHYNGKIYFGTSGTDVIVGSTTMSINTWYHVAVSRSSGTVRLFLNGVSDATAVTGNSTNHSDTNAFYIGIDGAYVTYPFTGYISNARLVKGTAVYTSTFTPPTTPLTAISGTSLLTCQSNRFIDNSTNAFTITKSGVGVTVSPNIPFTVNASYSTYGSTYFDGTGDYLSAPSNSAFAFGTGDFTLECWIYVSSPSDTPIYEGRTSGSSGLGFTLTAYSSTVIRIFCDSVLIAATVANYTNQWTHVAVVKNSGTTTLYINGVSGGTTSSLGNLTDSQPLIGAGRYAPGTSPSAYMLGYISNFRIVKGTAVYTTAFTPPTTPLTAIANTQLLTLQYNGGATNQGIIDNSNFNNIITRNGNTSQGTFSPYSVTGWSNYFDGTGDALIVPLSTALGMATGDFTIEFWIYLIAIGSRREILDFSNNNQPGRLMIRVETDGTLYNVGTDNTNRHGTATGAMPLNAWTHVALVRSSGTSKFYINGTQSGNNYTDAVNYGANQSQNSIGANASDYTSNPLYGYLSNFRIVKGTAVYTSTFTPPTSPLTAIANTQLLTCQSNRFLDISTNNFTLTPSGDVSVQAFSPFAPGVTYTPSLHGGSAYFDGTGDFLTTPDSSTVANFGTAPFTVEFWMYSTDAASVIIRQNAAGTPNWAILITSGNIYWQNGYEASSLYYIALTSLTTNPLRNAWTHIAITRNGSNQLKFWINGVGQSSVVTDSTNYNSTTGVVVGSGSYGAYTGYLSDVRITKGVAVYTTTFTPPAQTLGNYSATYPAQLLLNMNNGGIIDQHSTNVLETVGGAQLSTAVKKYGNASMYFDGTGDYLTIRNSQNFAFGSGNWTIELWIYLNSSARQGFVALGEASGSNVPWEIGVNASGKFRLLTQTSGGQIIMDSTTTPSTGIWYHVAGVRNGGTATLYVNGVAEATSSSLSTNSLTTETNAIQVGKYSYGFELNGYIDDLRITKGYARYTANFTAPTSAFITK